VIASRTGEATRTLTWDGCLNVRDLGGIPTTDGGTTRFGAILRADSIRRLSDEGWATLLGYGVSRIVDLRFHSELAADPPRQLSIDVVHVPVLPDLDSEQWSEIDALGDAEPDAVSATQTLYLEFLERFRENFGAAIEAVAGAPPEGAVLIHCVGGKDRTGLVSALVLRLADVPTADVAEDYALSAVNLRARAAAWIAEAADEVERVRRERISQTPAEAMSGVLEELERRYGSVEGYLEAGGTTQMARERIRARLR
jgi:protein-tyrosine phosphatase